jgi:hypothetical protein
MTQMQYNPSLQSIDPHDSEEEKAFAASPVLPPPPLVPQANEKRSHHPQLELRKEVQLKEVLPAKSISPSLR